ncbi:Predicted esterase of the alpha/beta hydrolase fold family [Polymorphum gilvum SL003B-26A1]|uniref:Predicted esterase of the alpha/beta hydrolase fold family n=1 Tax=Polymorphum gilvum (strain LMG 25793 / CGMCC 1.9160 / SL003B-26A1) TaxID=991905 RepID=F2J2E5_POLGS|nr:Predicted esterase of the alpha/beta hydrolase fold family [Polymorphum gilvum SL003B-26A1]
MHLGVPAIVAASRNDFWMDQARARDLAQTWGADFVDMGEAGHINVASGFGPWPAVKVFADRLSNFRDSGAFSSARRTQVQVAIAAVRS